MTVDWQPTSLVSLQARAEILAHIRAFFAQCNVMEVETPVLISKTVTDPYIQSLPVTVQGSTEPYFLHTSPEYAMKRLLAAGSGPIYQITKTFRGGESGRLHNPEFSMLEWYRPAFDEWQLMGEITQLIHHVLKTTDVDYQSYQDVFQTYVGFNPHSVSFAQLKDKTLEVLDEQHAVNSHVCLDVLFSHYVQPHLGHNTPTFIYDFPLSHAALAMVKENDDGQCVAKRFELFVNGIELANGYNELVDPDELERRWCADQVMRHSLGYVAVELDTKLLSAMQAGLPPCAGVAMGLDRLIMLALGQSSIRDTLAFPFESV